MKPVKDENGREIDEGVRMELFFYTGKTIISLSAFNKKKDQAFSLIKAMTDKTAITKGWKGQLKRLKNNTDYFQQDPLRFLPGIAVQLETRLAKEGITCIQDLATLNDTALNTVSSSARLSTKRLNTFRTRAQQAKEGNFIPKKYDFRSAENPFQARYGSNWEKNIYRAQYQECATRFV
jgi:predicted flap endonuclease-1-like 5' DNA nuclease